jgi:ABC-type sugar transport system ATPase subunit
MNIREARVGDDGRSVIVEGTRIDLGQDKPLAAGQAVFFGIRPEHVAIAGADKADLLLIVDAIETLGADALAHCHISGNDKRSDFVLRLPGTASLRVGERLPVALDRKALHVFDFESRRRVE